MELVVDLEFGKGGSLLMMIPFAREGLYIVVSKHTL